MLLTFYILLMILTSLIPTTLTAVSTGFFVDTAVNIFAGNLATNAIYLPLSLLLLVICLGSFLANVINLLDYRIKFYLERNLMPNLVTILASLSYKYIENDESWELIEIVSDEMTETFMDGIRAYSNVISNIIAIISLLIFVAMHVWWVAVILLFSIVPVFYIATWTGKRNYEAKEEALKYERRYSYYSDKMLTNREAVEERTLFGYASAIITKYYEAFFLASNIQLNVLFKTKFVVKSISFYLILIILFVSFSFINPLLSGIISSGVLIGIIVALVALIDIIGVQFQSSIKNIAEAQFYMSYVTKLLAFDKIEYATTTNKMDFKESINNKYTQIDSIEFVNVRFKYPNTDYYVLDGVNFKLLAGRHYSFVGVNGSGKSTIIKLLTKMYDEYEGQIFINNKELKSITLHEIQSLFSVVYQDFAKYQLSIAQNIDFDATNINGAKNTFHEQKILDVLNQLGLGVTINNLTNKIHTHIGKLDEDGVDFSGGQWQKIAIARAIIRNTPIKILDEPTAALDPISESEIYKEFETLVKGKITIFISHRLGSTKLSDEILLIDKGRIAERGSHHQLMQDKGSYFNMFEAQREWYN